MLCFGIDSFGSYTIKIEKKGRIDECKREWKGEKVADLRVSFVRTSGRLLSKLFFFHRIILFNYMSIIPVLFKSQPIPCFMSALNMYLLF